LKQYGNETREERQENNSARPSRRQLAFFPDVQLHLSTCPFSPPGTGHPGGRILPTFICLSISATKTREFQLPLMHRSDATARACLRTLAWTRWRYHAHLDFAFPYPGIPAPNISLQNVLSKFRVDRLFVIPESSSVPSPALSTDSRHGKTTTSPTCSSWFQISKAACRCTLQNRRSICVDLSLVFLRKIRQLTQVHCPNVTALLPHVQSSSPPITCHSGFLISFFLYIARIRRPCSSLRASQRHGNSRVRRNGRDRRG
jgi:hypothetical protein